MRFPITTRRNEADSTPFSLFDNFFREFFTDPAVANRTGDRTPLVNIAESETAVTLEFELPGVAPDAVDIEVLGNRLTVKAERGKSLNEGDKLHAVEHFHGSMTRHVSLPRGLDTESIEARFENGLLTIVVPKTEPAKPRKIQIKD